MSHRTLSEDARQTEAPVDEELDQLIERCRRLLLDAAKRIVKNDADAEDAVQEACTEALLEAKSGVKIRFARYLYTKVCWKAQRIRRDRRQARAQPLIDERSSNAGLSPSDEAVIQEQQFRVQAVLTELSPLMREAFCGHYSQPKMLTMTEAARLVGCDRGTLSDRFKEIWQRFGLGERP